MHNAELSSAEQFCVSSPYYKFDLLRKVHSSKDFIREPVLSLLVITSAYSRPNPLGRVRYGKLVVHQVAKQFLHLL
jgi:hypothetical protein